MALYGAETWTLWKVDQKYLESCEMCFYRRMERISWIDRVKNELVLLIVKERTIKRRKANWIGHIWHRNCFIRYIIKGKIEGKVEVAGQRGRRRKQLLDDLKEKTR
jgi:hypothetical protein